MRINASGNVGIGETAPDYPLEIARAQELLLSLKRPGVGEWRLGVDSNNSLVFNDNGTNHVVIDTLGNVGIGQTNPTSELHLGDAQDSSIDVTLEANRSGAGSSLGQLNALWNGNQVATIAMLTGGDTVNKDDGQIAFYTSTSGPSIAERMRLDEAGRLLVGKNTSNVNTEGVEVRQTELLVTRASGNPITANRLTSDGLILSCAKDGTFVGGLTSVSGLTMAIDGGTGFTGLQFGSSAIVPRDNGAVVNATVDLGTASAAFGTAYLGDSLEWPSSDSLITSIASQVFIIDSNNDGTGNVFVWKHNGATSGTSTELMRLTDAGRLGLGTSSPVYRLHVSDATSPQIGITDTTNNATFYAGALDTSVILGSDSNHDVRIAANSSEVARFTASGGRLQLVNGGTAADPLIRTTGDTDTGLFWPNGNALGFAFGGTEAARFDSNGAFRVGDGAAATPSIAFNDDPNTGIYSPSADIIAFTTGGARRAYVSNNGVYNDVNGTAALPSYSFNSDPDTGMFLDGTVLAFSFGGTRRLSVDGDRVLFETQMRGLGGSATTPDYSFNNDSDTGMFRISSNALGFSCAGTRIGFFNTNGFIVDLGGSAANPSYTWNADQDTGLYNVADGVIGFTCNGALRARVDFAGLRIDSGTIRSLNGSAAEPAFRFQNDGDTGIYLAAAGQLAFAVGGTERFRLDSSGRLSTNGEAAADVDAGGLTLNQGTNNNNIFTIKHTNVAHGITSSDETDTYFSVRPAFSNTGGAQMRGYCEASGVAGIEIFGIKSGTPTGDGAVQINSAQGSGTSLTGITSGTHRLVTFANNSSVYAYFTGTEDFHVLNGDIYVPSHTTTASAANAVINSSTGVLQRSTSSIRYKKDVTLINESLSNKLYQIEAVTYKSNVESDDQNLVHLGMIAEQLDAIGLRELVVYKDYEDGNGPIPESVQYERATALLVSEVQKHEEKVKNLEERLAVLESMLLNQ